MALQLVPLAVAISNVVGAGALLDSVAANFLAPQTSAVDAAYSACPALRNGKFYVLNLQRRPDRLHKLRETMLRDAPWLCQLSCRVVAPDPAEEGQPDKHLVDESIWQAVQSLNTSRRIFGGSLTKGGVGCYLGYVKAMHQLQKSDGHWGMIIEDDTDAFTANFANYMCNAFDDSSTPRGWDLLKTQSCGTSVPRTNVQPSLSNGFGRCTGSFLFTKESSSEIVKQMIPIQSNSQADDRLSSLSGIKSMSMDPPMTSAPLSEYGDTDVQQFGNAKKMDRTSRTTG
jgi:hypothetical protein